MEIKLQVGYVDVDLIDHWYKANYWATQNGALGEVKTGPFTYYQGHRKAVLWDGAGTAVLEILDLDYPPRPNSISDSAAAGRAFHYVKNKLLSYGEHRWSHQKTEE
jgi:hypothetical protein